MLFWIGLVVGLIIGWLVEWFIDWRFWRQELHESLDEERRWRTELENAHREIGRLQDQVAQLSGQPAGDDADKITTEAATTATTGNTVAHETDEFERIKGIGRAFAQRLHAAGIHTFAQLAQLPPERIVEIIHPEPRQVIDTAAWIAQARELAPKKQEAS